MEEYSELERTGTQRTHWVHIIQSLTNVSPYGLTYRYLGLPQQQCTYKDHARSTETSAKSLAYCGPFHDVPCLSTSMQGAGTGEHLGFAKQIADTLLLLSMCSGNNRARQDQPKCYHMYWNARQITPEHNVYPEKHKRHIEQKAAPADLHVKVSLVLFLFHVFLQLLLLNAAHHVLF